MTLDIPTLIALLVCLIPTTIGALLAAIGIAGMDRALMANIIAKSGKAVELAGDIDTLLLDKTGTITIGNRKATQFVPLGGCIGASWPAWPDCRRWPTDARGQEHPRARPARGGHRRRGSSRAQRSSSSLPRRE